MMFVTESLSCSDKDITCPGGSANQYVSGCSRERKKQWRHTVARNCAVFFDTKAGCEGSKEDRHFFMVSVFGASRLQFFRKKKQHLQLVFSEEERMVDFYAFFW